MLVTFISAMLASMLAPAALAVPGAKTVLTPHGERPISSVHRVPEGGMIRHVKDEVHLLDSNNNILHVAKNTGRPFRSFSKRSFQSGWVATAGWWNLSPDPITSFGTKWDVPEAPANYHGQTIFSFNGLEPNGGAAILQPVLQYGPSAAGGGEYWAAASWYVHDSQAYFSSLVMVNTTDTLDGVMSLDSHSSSSFNYVSSFTNIPGTSLKAENSTELIWATEVLEIYGVDTASDLPASSTVFSDINVQTTAGTPDIKWDASSDSGEGIACIVNTDGATNAKITVSY